MGRLGASVQASLFDVSNLASPQRVSVLDFGPGATPVEFEPHAFLFWKGLAVMPFSGGGFTGVLGLRTSPLAEAGRVAHPDGAPVERSLAIGDKLYTLSYKGLAENRLGDLSSVGFTAFG